MKTSQNSDSPALTPQESKLTCLEAAQTYLNIEKYPAKNIQAFLLQRDFGFTRKTFINEKFGSDAGKSRAKECIRTGHDPCRRGPHQRLSDDDESILEYWVLTLISIGRVVYPTTLMELVCTNISPFSKNSIQHESLKIPQLLAVG